MHDGVWGVCAHQSRCRGLDGAMRQREGEVSILHQGRGHREVKVRGSGRHL